MKKILLVFLSASIMMGCSTAYRTGQTTDDVYFSPARPGSEYVNLEENDAYRPSEVPMTDRYLRMKAFGSSRWNSFDDDFAYWNNPHWNNRNYFDVFPSFGLSGMNNPYFGRSMLFGQPNFLNPFSPIFYGQPLIVFNTGKLPNPSSSGPRTYALSNYTPRATVTNTKTGMGLFRTGSQNSSGGTPRGGYNPRSSGESYGSPSRTFSNSSNSGSSGSSSSSSGSSSGSSSSGSAPVRSFPRGGN